VFTHFLFLWKHRASWCCLFLVLAILYGDSLFLRYCTSISCFFHSCVAYNFRRLLLLRQVRSWCCRGNIGVAYKQALLLLLLLLLLLKLLLNKELLLQLLRIQFFTRLYLLNRCLLFDIFNFNFVFEVKINNIKEAIVAVITLTIVLLIRFTSLSFTCIAFLLGTLCRRALAVFLRTRPLSIFLRSVLNFWASVL
jgi:hypothetical protein